jgi:hypothetical protein
VEKHILRWSYWLGVASILLALLTRALDVFGAFPVVLRGQGDPISFHTFLNGTLIFFLAAIASSCYAWSKIQKL